jgi:hypothetical protein
MRFDNGFGCFGCFNSQPFGFNSVFKKITNPSIKTNPQLAKS